nr:phage portal protein [Escherichia coli]
MTAVRRWDITSARTGIPDAQKWTWIPRELPGGRASFIHVFEPVEDGQTRGANVFYSVMEQMKMLDTLQNTAAERHCEGDVCRHH